MTEILWFSDYPSFSTGVPQVHEIRFMRMARDFNRSPKVCVSYDTIKVTTVKRAVPFASRQSIKSKGIQSFIIIPIAI